ncbi:MAG: O-antigen ligase family protein [Pseudobutyrivibrio sp.]|nr:O-antigen ligase family protein [Pseudobutyrivibrio sp.]
MKEILLKNKKFITMFLIAGLLFARCNLGVYYGGLYVMINVLFNGLALAYSLVLFTDSKKEAKNALVNPAIIWIVLFSLLVFIYGHFKLFTAADYYSRMVTILTVAPAILILVLLFYNKDEVIDILSVSGSVVIITTLITSLCYDEIWGEWLQGMYSRVGATPAGGCIDTGNLVLILLIPIFYQLFVLRKVKQYLWITLIGIFEIVITGAKSSVLPIVFVFAIMIIGASDDKRIIRRNLIILTVAAVLAFAAIMIVPPLYGVVGYRIAELFTGVNSAEPDLHTSTGQRMAMINAFKAHFWEAPLFGHGFYSFREMPYSAIEEFRQGTEISYRNVQLHMNYLEVLFSYGILGFVLYYWFPVYVIIKSFRANKMAKIMVFSIMISFVFMDLGIDMYYKYLLPYYSYFLAYFFTEKDKDVLQ